MIFEEKNIFKKISIEQYQRMQVHDSNMSESQPPLPPACKNTCLINQTVTAKTTCPDDCESMKHCVNCYYIYIYIYIYIYVCVCECVCFCIAWILVLLMRNLKGIQISKAHWWACQSTSLLKKLTPFSSHLCCIKPITYFWWCNDDVSSTANQSKLKIY